MKKTLKITLATMCAAGIFFTGCGSKTEDVSTASVVADENVTAPGELPIVKEPIDMQIGLLATSKVENYETNAFTKYLEEKTGINLSFYEFPASGGVEKLNVMLASRSELPEVLSGFSLNKGTFLQYADEEIFLDLTDYFDNYSYWMKDVYKNTKVKNLDGYLRSENGKRYYFPSISEFYGNYYSGKAFINQAWLEKLGLKMPETIEEFADVMRAFREKDPNGNGKADEIGLTGSTGGWCEKPVNFLMNSFVYDDFTDGFVVDDDLKISLNYRTEEYKEGLKYISGLIKEELVDVQSYTQGNDILRALCSADELTVGAFVSSSPDNLFPEGSERLREFVALPPLKGPKGVAFAKVLDYNAYSSGMITKYCKNPLAAFRLLDFMMSEEASLFSVYGVEGTDWKEVDENSPALFKDSGYKARILRILPYGTVQNSHWAQQNPNFSSSAIMDTAAWDGDELDGEYFKAKAAAAYEGKGPKNNFQIVKMILPLDEMTEFNELKAGISEYVKENIALFATGELDIDKEWDSFQEALDNLGVERYIELAQMGYDKFNGK